MREVILQEHGDFAEWRREARRLLVAQVAPQDVDWRRQDDCASLFGEDDVHAETAQVLVSVPRALLSMAERVICLNERSAPARLYRILWRVADDPRLLERTADDDIDWLRKADKMIRRDMHKMHAFVRFRRQIAEGDRESFVAWFEPAHHILRLTAPFFQRRFYGMDWTIVTPTARAIWKDELLSFGPGGVRSEVPQSDVIEDQWRTYYGAIFNPARVKINAMRAEMPKKYWKNLPEAQDIAPLLADANARVERMRSAAVSVANPKAETWRKRVNDDASIDDAGTLDDLARLIGHCTRCPLHCNATQAVAGEGPGNAQFMLVGEQPGDQEDLTGRPFVGPAGQLLNEALREAGLDRAQIYLTNAVKHFKFESRGKRRLHQNPTAGEIDICRWWLDKERQLVNPHLIISLGRSAFRGVTGQSQSIRSVRGAPIDLPGGARLIATVHPSYLLRLPDPDRAAKERAAFVEDLARARRLAA